MVMVSVTAIMIIDQTGSCPGSQQAITGMAPGTVTIIFTMIQVTDDSHWHLSCTVAAAVQARAQLRLRYRQASSRRRSYRFQDA